MRIAVVHSFYSSAQPSGENVVVDEQVAALTADGHDVLLISRRTDDEQKALAYTVRAAARVATGRGESPDTELAEFRPQVVHLHNTFPNFGTRWLGSWGSRTVATLHNYRTVCAAGTLFRAGQECTDCLETPALPGIRYRCYRGSRISTVPVALGAMPGGGLRRVLHSSARLVALNQAQASLLARIAGRPVDVVPNFVRSASGREHHKRWAYVGRLSAEKGIAELLEAWPAEPSIDVLGDGELGERLREKFSARPNISFAGVIPRDKLLADLGSYQGLVVPSQCSEGLPTVILEALARGVPSVVSRFVSSGAELESAGVSVRLPSNHITTQDLAVAMASVQHAGDAMRSACVDLHSRRYSPTAWLASMQPIYEAVSAGTA